MFKSILYQFLKADSLYYIGWDISIQHPQTYVCVVMKRQKQQRVLFGNMKVFYNK